MHSNLVRVVREMAGCNGFGVRPIEQWQHLVTEWDIVQLDEQAAMLEGEDLLLFVDGEQTESERITESLQIKELDTFLNCVFEGYLHDDITL